MDPTLARIEGEIPRLRRYARFLCGDREQADDLLQECLVRAIDKLHTWQPGTNLGAWLFTILRNFYIDEVKRHRRPDTLEIEDRLPELAVPGGQETHVQCLEMWEALQLLSPAHREVLDLVVVEGLTYEQTAELLDVAVGTVRSRLSRARAALRLWLHGKPPHSLRTRAIIDPYRRAGARAHIAIGGWRTFANSRAGAA